MERINVDFSHLEGTNCYCSAESAAVIRQEIAGLPAAAFHCIGTGDYHYQTLFWLEKLQEPFCLVLFDNHPDDQDGAFGGELLSCGGWVAAARRLPCCRADVIDGKPVGMKDDETFRHLREYLIREYLSEGIRR